MAFNMPRYLLHLRPLARHRPGENAGLHPALAELRRRLRHGARHGGARRLQLLRHSLPGDDGALGAVPQDDLSGGVPTRKFAAWYLVNIQKAIENGHVDIVDLPMKHGDFP